MCESHFSSECLSAFEVVHMLLISQVVDPEAVLRLRGVHEVESVGRELFVFVLPGGEVVLHPTLAQHLLSHVVVVPNHQEDLLVQRQTVLLQVRGHGSVHHLLASMVETDDIIC